MPVRSTTFEYQRACNEEQRRDRLPSDIENSHLTPKALIRFHKSPSQRKTIALVLLDIRIFSKADTKLSAAALVFGARILPAEGFFKPQNPDSLALQTYVTCLSTYMKKIPPVKARLQRQQMFALTELETCSHASITVYYETTNNEQVFSHHKPEMTSTTSNSAFIMSANCFEIMHLLELLSVAQSRSSPFAINHHSTHKIR